MYVNPSDSASIILPLTINISILTVVNSCSSSNSLIIVNLYSFTSSPSFTLIGTSVTKSNNVTDFVLTCNLYVSFAILICAKLFVTVATISAISQSVPTLIAYSPSLTLVASLLLTFNEFKSNTLFFLYKVNVYSDSVPASLLTVILTCLLKLFPIVIYFDAVSKL